MAADDVELVFEEATAGMEKALRSLRAELQKVRTGRASASLLDSKAASQSAVQKHPARLARTRNAN